jgi:hypothetical protein
VSFTCFFDANTHHHLREGGDGDGEHELYRRLLAGAPDSFVEVPGRIRADEFILQRAHEDQCPIISNDQFREYAGKYPWLSDSRRLIKFVVSRERIAIPQMSIDCRL